MRNIQTSSSSVPAIVTDNETPYKYTAEDMWTLGQCGEMTFKRWIASFSNIDDTKVYRDKAPSTGGRPSYLYTDKALKDFSMWLKANNIKSGRSSDAIKQDNAQDLVVGCVFTKGSITEKRAFLQMMTDIVDREEQSQQTIADLNGQVLQLTDERDRAVESEKLVYKCAEDFQRQYSWTATMLGERYGVHCQTIGKLAKKLGLKNDTKYCMTGKVWVENGSISGWRDSFQYSDMAVQEFDRYYGVVL